MSWYKKLKPEERHTFIGAFGGWALDALDFMVFTFCISTLINLWGIDRGQAGMLGTVTLLFSAVGGWGAGIIADRIGRVKVLQYSIIWFTVCTVLIGFTQNFEQLFILRALQGLGFGGEWAVGSVLMGEIVRAEYRGRAVGTVQSGWAIGWGVAAILYSIAFSVLPEEWAWRSLFWVSVIPGFLVIYVRKKVPEPEIFIETKEKSKNKGINFVEIFSPQMLKTTILASLLCTGIQGGYYAITTWLPTFLKTERHLSVLGTSGYLAVIIVGSFLGYLCGAWFADRFGRRANLIIFSLLSVVSLYLYTEFTLSNGLMLLLGFPLGFSASGIFSSLGAFLTELYPSHIRASGQGFTYNFGRGIGALFPALVGYLSQNMGLGMAVGIFAGGAYIVVILTSLLLPETKGRDLRELD